MKLPKVLTSCPVNTSLKSRWRRSGDRSRSIGNPTADAAARRTGYER
jgi:hypothetical protein